MIPEAFNRSVRDNLLDPRWEWEEIRSMDTGDAVYFVPVACAHADVVDVTLSLTGETVAHLCTTCWAVSHLPGWS